MSFQIQSGGSVVSEDIYGEIVVEVMTLCKSRWGLHLLQADGAEFQSLNPDLRSPTVKPAKPIKLPLFLSVVIMRYPIPFIAILFVLSAAFNCVAQEKSKTPDELEFLQSMIGVWDAKFEIWQSADADPLIMKGTETITAYGKHWLASDLVSSFGGQTMKVHSIIGYDLDKKKLVGTIIDHGPYAATMTGEYDKKSKTVHWKTLAKDLDGTRIVQNTSMTQKSETERTLVLKVAGQKKGEFRKFMQITFTKRRK